jgi:hypothetical protein
MFKAPAPILSSFDASCYANSADFRASMSDVLHGKRIHRFACHVRTPRWASALLGSRSFKRLVAWITSVRACADVAIDGASPANRNQPGHLLCPTVTDWSTSDWLLIDVQIRGTG